MFGFSVRTLTNGLGSPKSVGSPCSGVSPNHPESPKTEVGEIDTRQPFESVRAAVSLFGDTTGSPRARPVTKKTKAEEQKLLEREAQHHMALRELDHYKDQLKSTKGAKAKASRDLQIANRSVQDLTNKLEAICESKQAAIKAAEAAKNRTKELEEQKSMQEQFGREAWKANLDSERQLYKTNSREVISIKQELTNLRQDFDSALEAKLAAFQQEENARHTSEENQEMQEHLSGEVMSLKTTLEQVKLAALQAEEEHMKLIAEKEIHLIVHKTSKEVADTEINRLKGVSKNEDNLEQKLEETTGAIEVLQEQLNDVRASDFYSLQAIVSELNCGKKELQDAEEEEASIRSKVNSLNLQVEEVREKLLECMKLALEKEGTVQQLQAEIDSMKAELAEAMSRDITGEMEMQLSKLLEEGEKDRQYSEEIAKEVEQTRKEAEAAAIASKETDEKHESALMEAEAAKAALKLADDQIYNSSRPDGDDDPKDLESVRTIRLSSEEFKSMNSKIEECTKHADEKVEILMAEVHILSRREKQVRRKVEELLKECEIVQSETEDALKQAESTEAAKSIAKDELRKWIEAQNSILEEKSQ